MDPRCESACDRARTGFSIIEALIVLVIVATVVGALTPSVVRQLSRARTNRAAAVVAANFFLAQSLAGRQHRPVIMSFDGSAKTLRISQAASGTALVERRFGLDSEFKLTTLSASPGSVLILPNGMASASMTVTVGGPSGNRQVRMTKAGLVRVL